MMLPAMPIKVQDSVTMVITCTHKASLSACWQHAGMQGRAHHRQTASHCPVDTHVFCPVDTLQPDEELGSVLENVSL